MAMSISEGEEVRWLPRYRGPVATLMASVRNRLASIIYYVLTGQQALALARLLGVLDARYFCPSFFNLLDA